MKHLKYLSVFLPLILLSVSYGQQPPPPATTVSFYNSFTILLDKKLESSETASSKSIVPKEAIRDKVLDERTKLLRTQEAAQKLREEFTEIKRYAAGNRALLQYIEGRIKGFEQRAQVTDLALKANARTLDVAEKEVQKARTSYYDVGRENSKIKGAVEAVYGIWNADRSDSNWRALAKQINSIARTKNISSNVSIGRSPAGAAIKYRSIDGQPQTTRAGIISFPVGFYYFWYELNGTKHGETLYSIVNPQERVPR